MNRACDLAAPCATAPLKLVEQSPGTRAVLIFAPVFQQGTVPDTVEGRRNRLVGFHVCLLNLLPLLDPVLENARTAGMKCSIRDELSQPDPGPPTDFPFHAKFPIAVAGRTWKASFSGTNAYQGVGQGFGPWATLAGGSVEAGTEELTIAGRTFDGRIFEKTFIGTKTPGGQKPVEPLSGQKQPGEMPEQPYSQDHEPGQQQPGHGQQPGIQNARITDEQLRDKTYIWMWVCEDISPAGSAECIGCPWRAVSPSPACGRRSRIVQRSRRIRTSARSPKWRSPTRRTSPRP